jgi:hypothetical protein
MASTLEWLIVEYQIPYHYPWSSLVHIIISGSDPSLTLKERRQKPRL